MWGGSIHDLVRLTLKPDSSADHSADTWTAARPAAANLALDVDTSVFIAESHATCAVVALVIGVERTRETSGGSAGVGIGVGKLERLHRGGGSKSFYDTKGDNSFMLLSGCAAATG